MNTDPDQLLERLISGTLSAAESAALSQLMAEDPAFAERVAHFTRLDSELGSAVREESRSALYHRRMARAAAGCPPPRRSRRVILKLAGAGAGLAAVLALTQRMVSRPEADPDKAVATAAGSVTLTETPPESAFAAPQMSPAALRTALRRFYIPGNAIESVPVSTALAALESLWLAECGPEAVRFTVAPEVRRQWRKPEDEPRVSLEIPGISLLTSLELIAASAGLRTAVTESGVELAADTRRDDGRERTWTIPLPAAVLTPFLIDLIDAADRADLEIARRNREESGLTAPGLVSAPRPSWLVAGRLISGPMATVWTDDDFTIDLNVEPEVIEFEGFINYGTPIQTTGINALGGEEPVILTDSKITQPVFATRQLREPPDGAASVTKLLAAHGFSGSGAAWDAESGMLTARGPLPAVSLAAALAAAITESAGEGLVMEFKRIEWSDNLLPEPGLLPKTNSSFTTAIVTAEEAGALLRLPAARLRETGRTTPSRATSLEIDASDSGGGARIVASPVKRLPGTSIMTTFQFHTPHGTLPVRIQTAGRWLRCDHPGNDSAPATTLLVRITPAAVAP